jgi:signal transduction histidine kinase/CheY-like chemotaxis protein
VAPEIDAGFTLDASVLAQRREAQVRRIQTVQIPAVRAAGFVIICIIALVQVQKGPAEVSTPALLALLALNLGYATIAWLVMRLGHAAWRSSRLGRRSDLSLVFFHLDLLVWLPNLYLLEQGQMFVAYFMLVRVVDQVGVGFRRALYFNHLLVLAYLAYSGWIAWAEPERALWAERLTIALVMYLLGWYLAYLGRVTERLRQRSRQAVRTARALVETLASKAEDLERQAHELDEARRESERANLAKSQFLAVTSHEIRTPMNGILGAAELLMGTTLTPTQERYVRTAHRSASALLALIDDVLDLSRIESGKLTLHPAPVELRALAQDALDLAAMTAHDKPLTLECSLEPGLPARMLADPVRLRQLLVNLLHNAVKFTERGQVRLEISVIAADEKLPTLRLQVQDTGIGIPPDKLAAVFESFTQVDASPTRRHGGTGLGLTIVRQLAELMNGQLGVASTPGVGSRFWIDLRLPVLPPERPAGTPPAPAFAPAVASAATPRAEAGRRALGGDDEEPPLLRVLLVEDNAVNQMVAHEMLKMLGCEVDLAVDGEEALALFLAAGTTSGEPEGPRYDLVLMDCHMPRMDGFEATRRIRGLEVKGAEPAGLVRTPIVALTADALESDRNRCLQAGMDDFLTKPVSSGQLAATIERWTGRATHAPTQW